MARNATVVDAKHLALAYHERFTDACDFRKGGQKNGAQAKNSNRFGAKATVRIKGIVLVSIEIFEEYLELFREDF